MSSPSTGSVNTVRQIPRRSDSSQERERSASTSAAAASPRSASIQRLAAPVPVVTRPSPPDSTVHSDTVSLENSQGTSAQVGPGRSAIAAALASYGRDPPRHGTPPVRSPSPPRPDAPAITERTHLLGSTPTNGHSNSNSAHITFGDPPASFRNQSPRALEDPEAVRRLLVQPEDVGRSHREQSSVRHSRRSRAPSEAPSSIHENVGAAGPGLDPDEFSSLQLQGGDMTRSIYRWAEGTDAKSVRTKRSRSFVMPRPETEEIDSVKAPGGFRRNYLDRQHRRGASPSVSESIAPDEEQAPRAGYQTSSFLEFLTLYGHFAGEELREEDELEDAGLLDDILEEEEGEEGGIGERRPLLRRQTTAADRRRQKTLSRSHGKASPWNAAATLLKSFVGTGVLFLPRAFLNGGMLFGSVVLLLVAALSYYCFILLVNTQLKIGGSFGDMGEQLYGKTLRLMILGSLVLSQVGFVSAYIVFTSENLRAFVEAVSKCSTFIDIKWLILMQLVILMPFSLIRNISRLAFTAYIADFFICLGLIYLYEQDISSLIKMGGPADIVSFNPSSWTLFIGTAIFTFEGIGLILPIQESMREPQKFPFVLGGVMIFITILFTSIGALSYAAFGSQTKTVILLNMPQDSKFVNAVQFLYSIAILLSTPLQLFPAVRILEQGIFKASGRRSPKVKWLKNGFRFLLCAICAVIAWGGADDLDKFVSLVGSFACIPLVYIYPPMLHYKAGATKTWHKVTDVILGVFGVAFMAYTTALTAISWTKGSPAEPGYCDQY